MVFELGCFYRHRGGRLLAIRGLIFTYFYGYSWVAEDNEGRLLPVGTDKSAASNWEQISRTEWEAALAFPAVDPDAPATSGQDPKQKEPPGDKGR